MCAQQPLRLPSLRPRQEDIAKYWSHPLAALAGLDGDHDQAGPSAWKWET